MNTNISFHLFLNYQINKYINNSLKIFQFLIDWMIYSILNASEEIFPKY